MARSHYENFAVASVLLPRRLVPHVHAVYAYCRWADDLADEAGGGSKALGLLRWWREELLSCYSGRPRHPVRVHRVTCVVDCGTAINPDVVRAQMEGGIAFGLTAALFGEIRVENGRALESNFHDYRMLTLADAPAIDVHVVDTGAEIGGIGETGVPPTLLGLSAPKSGYSSASMKTHPRTSSSAWPTLPLGSVSRKSSFAPRARV